MKKFSIYTNNVKFIYLNFGLTYTQHCGFYKYKPGRTHDAQTTITEKEKVRCTDDEKKVVDEALCPSFFFPYKIYTWYNISHFAYLSGTQSLYQYIYIYNIQCTT